MDTATAVLDALDAEGACGLGFVWPERSCVSLVKALCGALGLPSPAYGPWEAMGQRAATVACLERYGSMGAAHQAGLVETGHWMAVEREPCAFAAVDRPADLGPEDLGLPADERVFHVRPGDVLSWDGVVLTANEEVYEPPMAGCDMTGVCGVYGLRWVWTRQGLSHVVEGELGRVTRPKPCR